MEIEHEEHEGYDPDAEYDRKKDDEQFKAEEKTKNPIIAGLNSGLTKAMLLKEAVASCALDGETQCGTIEPKTETEKIFKEKTE